MSGRQQENQSLVENLGEGFFVAVAMMSFQLAASEDKSFEDEYNRYRDYIKKHPEDLEEI